MKIAFLVYNAFGIGGTIRSTVNLSSALAEAGHEVEIVSLYRTAERLSLAPDPRVHLRSLIDWRGRSLSGRHHPSAAQPSTMFCDQGVQRGPLAPSRLTDERVAAFLYRTDADVVVGTRPVVNGYLARYGRSRYVRVGQEHVTFEMHGDRLREEQNAALRRLDAFVTVSHADAASYEAALADAPTRVRCIPNAVPAPEVAPSTGDSRTIVAAGRLIPVKRYDRLIDAFARVAPDHPDWNLRLYGRGRREQQLRTHIDALGLYDRVRLMGAVSPIETEWAKGAIAAVSSDGEAFGMTIVEAMHCGVPVVSTDCPHGPGEIISHGEDGLLVPPDGGPEAFAEALRSLIEDDERRRAMGAAARVKAARYAPALVGAEYEELFRELLRDRPAAGASTPDREGAASRRGGPGARAAGSRWHPPGRGRASAPPGGRPPARDRPSVRELLGAGRRLLKGRSRAGARAVSSAPAGRPSARCAVTADGGLAVRLDVASLPAGPLDLLLSMRDAPETVEVRLPVPPSGEAADGRIEVRVPGRGALVLEEGRWDAYVAPREQGRARRVVADQVEQAGLLSLAPPEGPEVTAWIPYTTTGGHLSVRTWCRTGHAELERLSVGAGNLTGTVALYGEGGPERGAVFALVRRGPGEREVVSTAVTLGQNRFSFVLPHRRLLDRCGGDPKSGHEQDGPGGPDGYGLLDGTWALEFRSAPSAAPVAVGRVLGDSADRRRTDVFPACELTGAEPGRATELRPRFTVDHDLVLTVRSRPLEGGPSRAGTDTATAGVARG